MVGGPIGAEIGGVGFSSGVFFERENTDFRSPKPNFDFDSDFGFSSLFGFDSTTKNHIE